MKLMSLVQKIRINKIVKHNCVKIINRLQIRAKTEGQREEWNINLYLGKETKNLQW